MAKFICHAGGFAYLDQLEKIPAESRRFVLHQKNANGIWLICKLCDKQLYHVQDFMDQHVGSREHIKKLEQAQLGYHGECRQTGIEQMRAALEIEGRGFWWSEERNQYYVRHCETKEPVWMVIEDEMEHAVDRSGNSRRCLEELDEIDKETLPFVTESDRELSADANENISVNDRVEFLVLCAVYGLWSLVSGLSDV